MGLEEGLLTCSSPGTMPAPGPGAAESGEPPWLPGLGLEEEFDPGEERVVEEEPLAGMTRRRAIARMTTASTASREVGARSVMGVPEGSSGHSEVQERS